jgi:two-component system chemotaxis sensor kinase CheA
VVQYRDRILPLVPLCEVLSSCSPNTGEESEVLQVIVFQDGDRSVGMVVDRILDVVEDSIKVRQKTARKGLAGSAVVGKKVADFLDLNEVIRVAAEGWFDGAGRAADGKHVLVAEASSFSRGLIRTGLDMAGYHVLEAASVDEAVRKLEQQPVDVVLAALDLPREGSSALLHAMRGRPDWQDIPVMALADSPEQARLQNGHLREFQDCQVKFDREGMLESVGRLAAAVAAEAPGSLLAEQTPEVQTR